jgi:hypothetical protein
MEKLSLALAVAIAQINKQRAKTERRGWWGFFMKTDSMRGELATSSMVDGE